VSDKDTPWFTVELRDQASRSGDKESKYRFTNTAKRWNSDKLQHQVSSGDSASVWRAQTSHTSHPGPPVGVPPLSQEAVDHQDQDLTPHQQLLPVGSRAHEQSPGPH